MINSFINKLEDELLSTSFMGGFVQSYLTIQWTQA